MKYLVVAIVCSVCSFLPALGLAAHGPCDLAEDAVRDAERELDRAQRDVIKAEDRLARTRQQRTDALLRNQDKGFQLLTDIYDAERERAIRLDDADDCWWGYSCRSYNNLRASLDRRVRRAKTRYAEWIQQTVTLTARWNSKVARMERNLAQAVARQQDAEQALAIALQAYNACIQPCTGSCVQPV